MNKQFLMIVDEYMMMRLQTTLHPDIKFLEVQGMDMMGNPDYKVLVSPAAPAVADQPQPATEHPPTQ